MIEYPTRVRIAKPEDEDELMEMCRELHRENGVFKLNEEKVLSYIKRATNNEGGILGVIGDSGKIEGMILIIFGSFWYSDDQHLEELYSFVRKEYRKSKNAVDLVNFSKWCSEKMNMKLVIGIMSDHRTAGKVRLYQRELGEPFGAFFLYPREGKSEN